MTAQPIYSTTIAWNPRYYYIKRNQTSGKLYVGQTIDKPETYLGTGPYWINHCKKHGGYNKGNIHNIWFQWFEEENEARKFLDNFEKQNPDYYIKENKVWANQVPEHTLDKTSAFSFPHVIEKRNETIADSDWRATVLVDKTNRMVQTRATTILENGNTLATECSLRAGKTMKSQEWKDKNYVECEYCNKTFSPWNYDKWHGDKCKHNPSYTPVMHKCEHCGLETTVKTNIVRYHGNKCKSLL